MTLCRRGNRVGGVKLAILFSILCGAGLAAAAWFLLPPRYESFAYVVVHNQAPFVLKSSEGTVDFQTAKNSAMAMLSSATVAEKALGDPAAGIKDVPLVKKQGIDAADWLADSLQVTNLGGGEWIRVSLVSEDSEGLNKIVNAVVDAYMNEVVEKERTEKLALRDSLNRKLQNYKNTLASKRRDLFMLNHEFGNQDDFIAKLNRTVESDLLQELMHSRKELLKKLAEAKLKKELLIARTGMAKDDNTVPEELIEQQITRDPNIVQATNDLKNLNRQLQEAQGKANGKDPTVAKIREQIKSVQQQIDQARADDRKQLIQQLSRLAGENSDEMKSLDVQIETFNRELESVTDDIRKQADNIQKLDRFNGDIDQLKTDIDGLSGLIRDMEVTLERRNIELDADSRVERGPPAGEAKPFEPLRRPIGTALAGLAGFSLAMVFAVMIHLLRK